MIRTERMIEEFVELVKVDSLSRAEAAFSKVLEQKLEELGLEVIWDKQSAVLTGADGGNLLGRLEANVSGVAPVFFAAHLDTVTPGAGIRPVIEGGIIKSSGDTILGADDKSGIAAILEALRHVIEEGLPHGEIEVLFTIGEEVGLLGSRHLDYSLLNSKVGFVFDNGGSPGNIVNQGPSQSNLKIAITGRAAHAGVNPEEGVSAIQVAARAIDRMKLLRIDEETTANIGIISGGNAKNIVCDQVVLEGEARSLSDDKLEQQVNHMLACLQEACTEFGAKLAVTRERVYSSFYVDPEDPLIKLARRAAAVIGLESKVETTGGGSDVNNFNARGLKAINLGTGMAKVHTTEEYLSIEGFVNTARFVAALIDEIAGATE